MIKTDFISTGVIEANCYFLYDDISSKAIIIDPGEEPRLIIEKITELNLKPELIINTHGHFDHIASDDIIREKYNIPLAIHRNDLPILSDSLKNGSVLTGHHVQIKPADIVFEKEEQMQSGFCNYSLIHTPGHSSGSICILAGNMLFSGDTLFKETIGRTDLPGGNHNDMLSSLEKLKKLDKKIIVYPGHGQPTTIEQELLNNFFFR